MGNDYEGAILARQDWDEIYEDEDGRDWDALGFNRAIDAKMEKGEEIAPYYDPYFDPYTILMEAAQKGD